MDWNKDPSEEVQYELRTIYPTTQVYSKTKFVPDEMITYNNIIEFKISRSKIIFAEGVTAYFKLYKFVSHDDNKVGNWNSNVKVIDF